MNTQTGARLRGAVKHYMRSGGPVAICGRYVLPGKGEGLRDCRTCVRIGKITTGTETERLWELVTSRIGREKAEEFINIPRHASQWAMFTDVVDAYEKGEENNPVRIALYKLALAKKGLRTLESVPEETRKGGGNPNAGMIDPRNARPARKARHGASEGQVRYILMLIAQIGEFNLEMGEALAEMYTEEYMDAIPWDGDKNVSAHLDTLKNLLAKTKKKSAAEISEKVAKSGLKEDSICVKDGQYFKIHRAKAGHLYAIVWEDGRWNWDATPKGVIRSLTPDMLITAEQASEFGHTYHRCVFCARELTDPRSEAVGYGPTCADNHGLPWGE